jgi:hypothetical protein
MGGKYWRDQTRAMEQPEWTDATKSAATATRAATGAKNFQKRCFPVKPVWRSRGRYTQESRLQLQLPKRDVRRHQFGKVIGSSAWLQLITALSCGGFWVSSGARQRSSVVGWIPWRSLTPLKRSDPNFSWHPCSPAKIEEAPFPLPPPTSSFLKATCPQLFRVRKL